MSVPIKINGYRTLSVETAVPVDEFSLLLYVALAVVSMGLACWLGRIPSSRIRAQPFGTFAGVPFIASKSLGSVGYLAVFLLWAFAWFFAMFAAWVAAGLLTS